MTTPLLVQQASIAACDAFHILLLCDGFQDENAFKERCRVIVKGVFSIPPFSKGSPLHSQITFWALFTPSIKEGIDWDPVNTLFGSYFDANYIFQCQNPQAILDIVNGILSLKDVPFSSDYVWRNPESKSFGAIAILLNTDPSNQRLRGARLEVPSSRVKEHYFGLPLGNYDSADDLNPTPPIKLFHHVFIHELAHAIYGYVREPDGGKSIEKAGLLDEYEVAFQDVRISFPAAKENDLPNLTLASTINSNNPDPIENRIKWRNLMTSRELNELRQSPGNAIIFKPAGSFDNNRHSNDPDGDTLRLVEGGYTFSHGIFRPSLKCKMRWSEDPFCKVCEDHISRAISGFNGCVIGNLPSYAIADMVKNKKLMERLILSLTNHIDLQTSALRPLLLTQSTLEISVRSAARMALMLNQLGVSLFSLSFLIDSAHVCLRYGHLVIDPTFYHLYADPLSATGYSYTYEETFTPISIGEEGRERDENSVSFADGFIGDTGELEKHLTTYFPPSYTPFLNILSKPAGYEVELNPEDGKYRFIGSPPSGPAEMIRNELQTYSDFSNNDPLNLKVRI